MTPACEACQCDGACVGDGSLPLLLSPSSGRSFPRVREEGRTATLRERGSKVKRVRGGYVVRRGIRERGKGIRERGGLKEES